jgi:hypothetical protein
MVALNEDLVIRSLEVVPQLLHSLLHGQEHLIVRIIDLFGTCAFSRVVVHRSENRETVILFEKLGYGEAASIGLQNDWLYWIEMVENWCIG